VITIVRVGAASLLAVLLTWAIAAVWPAPPVERATLASVAFVPILVAILLAVFAWRPRARPGSARRSLFALHRRLGGALVVVAIVVFGSGVGAVLDRSSSTWQLDHAPARESPPPLAEQPLDRVLESLLAEYPHLRRGELAIHPATLEQPWIRADLLGPAREHVRIDFDPHTGRELGRGEGPLAVVRELHRRLLVPPMIGESALGLIAVALALVTLAGLATRRRWLQSLTAGVRRSTPDARPRAPLAMRMHQWLGFSLLGPALVWACSGALLGLTLVIVPIVERAVYEGDRAALMREVLAVDRPLPSDDTAPLPNLAELAATRCPAVDEALPEAEVHRFVVRHPGQASGNVRVDLEGRGLRERGSFTRAGDGSLLDCRALPHSGVGLQAFMITIVLHYGEWGPPWLIDLVYVALGSTLIALAGLGGRLLVRRRERDGQQAAALRMRRLLIGVGLGLAIACANLLVLSRVPVLARNESIATLSFGLGWMFVIGFSWIGDPDRRRRDLLIVLALLLLVVPPLGWSFAGVGPGVVEATLIVLGLLTLRLATRYNQAMPRRLAPLALVLLFASTSIACSGKDEEKVDPAKAKKDQEAKDAKKDDAAVATTEPPVPVSDEAIEPPEDRSCDPKDKGACLEGETCVGSQGCEAVWECDDEVTCKKGAREYCGCDGKTFEAEYGNCPTQKYQYAGPCK
jgi:hypothetical protein